MHTQAVVTDAYSSGGRGDTNGEVITHSEGSCLVWEALVKLYLQDSTVTREHKAKVSLSNREKVEEFLRGGRGLLEYFSAFSFTCLRAFSVSLSPLRD